MFDHVDGERHIYLDMSDPPRKYKAYKSGGGCIVRHRARPSTDAEDACMHLLKLHHATRMQCTEWLEVTGFGSYFDVAKEWLLEELMVGIMPLLPTSHGAQQENDQLALLALNHNQRQVLDLIVNNMGLHLICGSSGTEKSTLIRALVQRLKIDGIYEPVVLAPSGKAAENINGTTIHHFFWSHHWNK